MKLCVIGANGQLGHDLLLAGQQTAHEVIPFMGRDELDVTSQEAVTAAISAAEPGAVINAAARCDVDACESDALRAFEVNALGARNLALACQQEGAFLFHISTDYVFSGEKNSPYIETDAPSPINTYGVSKRAGEHFVQSICEQHLIVRTSGLYGPRGSREKGGNFVKTMIALSENTDRLKGVADQTLSPTYTLDLAGAIFGLLDELPTGILHLCNAGACSWYDWAREVFRLLGREVEVEPVGMDAFPRPARRPRYTALESARLREIGCPALPVWQDALERYLHATQASRDQD